MTIGNGVSICMLVSFWLTFGFDSIANVSIAFTPFGLAGGSCTMWTVLSLQMVIL